MSAGGCHFKGTLHGFLPFHVDEVVAALCLSCIELLTGVDHRRRERLLALQEKHHLTERLHAVHFQFVHHCCLTLVFLRHKKSLKALFARLYGNGQRALDSTHRAIKPKFAHKDVLVEVVRWDASERSEHTYCQGQVVAAALLTHVGRRKVDGVLLAQGKRKAAVLQRALHTELTLAYGIVGQSHHEEDGLVLLRMKFVGVDFEKHGHGGHAVDGGCMNSC